MSEHCLLPDRCTCAACRADAYKERAEAAEAKLAAIDAYVVQLRQEGGPVCNTVADHLTEFLHPKEDL